MTQPNTTAPAPEPAAAPPNPVAPAVPAKSRSHKRLLWAASAVCGVVALVLAFQGRKPQVPEKLPDPVASSQVVPVPGRAVRQDARATSVPSSLIPQVTPAAETATAETPVSVAAVAPTPGTGSDPARNQPQAEQADNNKAILEALQRNADAMAGLEQGVADLKAQVAKMTQAPRRTAQASAATTARPATARPTADTDSAQLLSIDLWGGKPSVVVGRTRGDGTEVTFLNEGEKQGRVTVKRADVGSQRAVLGTERGDVVLGREE